MLENFDTQYFVVSLPRSGTTSLNRMAEICGLKGRHAPCAHFENYFKRKNYNFFSDTPVYCPSVVESICKSDHCEVKFIYVDRDFKEIFDSWVSVGLYGNYTRMYEVFHNFRELMPKGKFYDFSNYDESFGQKFLDETNYEEIFQSHKQLVLSKIKEYNKDLLIYKFQDGWESFCKFLLCEVPNVELPHLNKNKMFD
jgi:hypothetical protein